MTTLDRRCRVLTISDRCSQGVADDTAGPAVAEVARDELHWDVIEASLLPDEAELIADQLTRWCDAGDCDVIFTVGGTGFSPRDVTPEATLRVIERRASPLMELARLRCFAKTPKTFLSRGEAGIRGQTLIVNLPGSRRGSIETLQAIADVLPHAVSTMRGENNHPPHPPKAAT
jgi:molybdenum cofactor synthesis domain-containing protein